MDRKTMTDRDLSPAAAGDMRQAGGEAQWTRTRTHIWGVRQQIQRASDQNDLPELHRLATIIEGAYDATGDQRYSALLNDCHTAAAVVHQTARDGQR